MISRTPQGSEIAELGEAIYHAQIEPTLSSSDQNRFVVIDVDSGDYEIADTDIAASLELMKRREPGRFYGVRVGHRAAYHLGGSSLKGWK